MSTTSSLRWPYLFNVAQNKVAVLENNPSIINRTKLLLLTEPGELYNEVNQGAGLRRYLFTYNNDNTKAIIIQKIREQLELHEPKVDATNTVFTDGLLMTGSAADLPEVKENKLEMTISLKTIEGDTVTVSTSSEEV